ncbi:MAG: hypothetical protein J5546_09605 [Lachnospiraceae bacterium]|nr:hypothetical protein [Lachnospiraceae bacterium]
MNCPFCNKEMQEGFVRGVSRRIGNSSIYWNDEDHKFTMFSNGIKLRADHHDFGYPAIKAYKCEDCQKVIMETGVDRL